MNYVKISKDDMLNGEGVRVVLWVSGCSHKCKNCHNPETWNPTYGQPFTDETMEELLQSLDQPHISGLTLSGGDPLHERNLVAISNIITMFREKFGLTKDIWLYTGYTYEQLLHKIESPIYSEYKIMRNIDVLCEGLFVENLKDSSLMWVGSSNQRVIDMRKTVERDEVVLYEH